MGRFAVHIMAQRAIGSPVNVRVNEGKETISFHLHGELNVFDTASGQGSPSACQVSVAR
jgi:hypothetical protein